MKDLSFWGMANILFSRLNTLPMIYVIWVFYVKMRSVPTLLARTELRYSWRAYLSTRSPSWMILLWNLLSLYSSGSKRDKYDNLSGS